jgi:hypothetical protein
MKKGKLMLTDAGVSAQHDEHFKQALASGWFPSKNVLIDLAPTIIDQIGLPWIKQAAATLPVLLTFDDAALKQWLLKTLADSQK